jgi:gamma-glutamyltranspeptidase/glutathione hydrolase
VLTNPDLAETFRTLAEFGSKEGFYTGRIAEAIVAATKEFGGVLELEDLAQHSTAFDEPSSTVYKGIRVYETPPPTHGVAALIALRLIEEVERLHSYKSHKGTTSFSLEEDRQAAFDFSSPNKTDRGSEYQAHIAIECMRVAFADCLQHISDPRVNEIPLEELLSAEYIHRRAQQINTERSSPVTATDFSAFAANETVYFCVVDREGNACSMINSNYMGFGSGIVPNGTGFTLHNRGHNFSLERGHPNQAAPRKRPYHTIIPALMTHESDGSLYGVFGNMVRSLFDFQLFSKD